MNSLNYSIKFGGRLDDRLFSRLCREKPDLRLERTSRGELVVMTPAGGESSGRNFRRGTDS
jgi:Uma2 family endonuclease